MQPTLRSIARDLFWAALIASLIAAILQSLKLEASAHAGTWTWTPIVGAGSTGNDETTLAPSPWTAFDGVLTVTYDPDSEIGTIGLSFPSEGLEAIGRHILTPTYLGPYIGIDVPYGYMGEIDVQITAMSLDDMTGAPVRVQVIRPSKGEGIAFRGQSVPEPSGLMLACIAIAVLAGMRRKIRHTS